MQSWFNGENRCKFLWWENSFSKVRCYMRPIIQKFTTTVYKKLELSLFPQLRLISQYVLGLCKAFRIGLCHLKTRWSKRKPKFEIRGYFSSKPKHEKRKWKLQQFMCYFQQSTIQLNSECETRDHFVSKPLPHKKKVCKTNRWQWNIKGKQLKNICSAVTHQQNHFLWEAGSKFVFQKTNNLNHLT